jgi:hypothetical protein
METDMDAGDVNPSRSISSDDFEERRPNRNDPYGTLDVVDSDDDATGEWEESPESRGEGDLDENDRPEVGVPIGTSGVGGGAPGTQAYLLEL